jgi:Uma2 family endonuclease
MIRWIDAAGEENMPTLIAEDVYLQIPPWVTDLQAFRRWTDQADFPETGNIWWLRAGVWADMSQEQIYTHNDVKGEIYSVLKAVAKANDIGRMFIDGLLLTNEEAAISGNPDATFISHEGLAEGRVVVVEGKIAGWTEVQGSPDMVLEVLSDSSEEKDLIILREDYFTAGIREYWLADARKSPLSLDILRRNSKGFVHTRRNGGWVKSAVFGKSFRLSEGKDRSGFPIYTLEVK